MLSALFIESSFFMNFMCFLRLCTHTIVLLLIIKSSEFRNRDSASFQPLYHLASVVQSHNLHQAFVRHIMGNGPLSRPHQHAIVV
jgi:hypothetical protein